MAENPGGTKPNRSAQLVSNILAIAGLIILIIVVIWGLLHLASLSSGWFSSLFRKTPARSAITVTVPDLAHTGEPTAISWTSTAKETKMAFSYDCTAGLTLAAPGPDQSVNPIPCGTTFSVTGATSTIFVVPFLSGTTTSATTKFSVLAMTDAGTPSAEGSATLKVALSEGSSASGPSVTPSKTTSGGSHAQTGNANLAVHIIAVGVINSYGEFEQRAPLSPSETAAVQFDISNTGGTATGSWTFEATLPTNQPYTYVSPIQESLAPGSHVVNTLRFTQIAPSGGVFTVSVDPSNTVHETEEIDNSASVSVPAPLSQYGNYYDQGYGYQQYQYAEYPQYDYDYSYPNQYSYPYNVYGF